MHKPLVLVVEDDKAVRSLLSTALDVNGYQCRSAETGLASLQEALSYKPDLILLDLGLPDMDGMEILKKIRLWSRVPILVVSARDEDRDKVAAFDAGADDYVTKPFSVDELMARLRAALRRVHSYADETTSSESEFRNGNLRVDYAAGQAFWGDQELHLTPMEYKLLCLLAKNVGKVLTHQFLFRELWGRAMDSEGSHLRVLMAALRKKVEAAVSSSPPQTSPASPLFQTQMGVGYRMVMSDKASS